MNCFGSWVCTRHQVGVKNVICWVHWMRGSENSYISGQNWLAFILSLHNRSRSSFWKVVCFQAMNNRRKCPEICQFNAHFGLTATLYFSICIDHKLTSILSKISGSQGSMKMSWVLKRRLVLSKTFASTTTHGLCYVFNLNAFLILISLTMNLRVLKPRS
jgi:hypothetical protein